MILVVMRMKVSVTKRKELTQTVASLLDLIRAEKGCCRCDLFRGLDDERTLFLLEEWDSRKDFETHCQSEYFKVLRGGTNLLDEPCEISSYRTLYKKEEKEAGVC
jgi:quinol monooxygenase YgiN